MIRPTADDPAAARGRSSPSAATPSPTLADDVRVVLRSSMALARVEALRLRSRLRDVVWTVGLGIFAFLAFAALTLGAGLALIFGIAGGLAELFGDRVWAGCLATAVLFFGGTFLAIRVVRARGAKQRMARLDETLAEVRAGANAPAPTADRVADRVTPRSKQVRT